MRSAFEAMLLRAEKTAKKIKAVATRAVSGPRGAYEPETADRGEARGLSTDAPASAADEIPETDLAPEVDEEEVFNELASLESAAPRSPSAPPSLSMAEPQGPKSATGAAVAAETKRAMLNGRLQTPLVISAFAVILFYGVFGTWAATAKLASGAPAEGVVSPIGSRKTVQHLEGGIIGEILAREGDAVVAGQPLIMLSQTQAQAGFDIFLDKRRTLAATVARLEAERDGQPSPEFPKFLTDAQSDPAVANILSAQMNLFETRTATQNGRESILSQRVLQLEEQIDGLEKQIASQTRQIELIDEEIADIEQLVSKGLERKSRLSGLERNKAEIDGERAQNQSAVAQSRQAIGEAQLQIINLKDNYRTEISEQLNAAITELSGIRQQMIASEDVLQRTVVTAPISGVVHNMRFNTLGGVIRPGEAVLDIVPAEEGLIIEARISPLDIDVVYQGLEAQVNLQAFSQRNLPLINGVVRSVSADALVDEATGESYFKANVAVDRAKLDDIEQKIGMEIDLVPGMPANVMIVTGHRTFLQYLIDPFSNSVRNSFRES